MQNVKKKTPNTTTQELIPALPASNATGNAAGNAAGSAAGSGASVDQIRNIIFGSQMEAYENRFNSLEDRILKELALQREESGRRFDSVREELAAERNQRTEEAARDRLAQEQQLNQEVDTLNADIEKRYQELLTLLNKRTDRLSDDKTNRRDLARLLSKMADQLSYDSKAAAASAKPKK